MALAFLFEDDTVMYIDAVQNYSKGYSSNISNHPIDGSGYITDHVSKDNPSFTIKGIISSADFNNYRSPEFDLGNNTVASEYNNPVDTVSIKDQSSFLSYLPGSVQQFIGSGNSASISSDAFRGYSHQIARDRLNKAWEKSEVITILDYDYDPFTGRSVSVQSIQNCLISRYTDSESVETGDSFSFTITFQRVRFAYLKETEVNVSQQTSPQVSDDVAEASSKGDQTTTGQDQEQLSVYDRYSGKFLDLITGDL